jgi:Ca2+-binding RTX toxin-like protein
VVDNGGDLVVENPDQGTDMVLADIDYLLTDNVENLTLTGTNTINGTGNTLDNVITGNSGDNILSGLTGNDVLIGNAGNDLLDGGTGADDMSGGLGDDSYVVDDIGDQVTELTGEGNDTVWSGINYTLGDNVENLVLTGTAAIKGTGNSLNNTMVGNTADNQLFGLSGNDILTGLGGNDWLDGGTGADTMSGGLGDDTYIVDNAGDLVVEFEGEGTDTVQSSVSTTLTDNVENLTLSGSASINGTGNELDNVITGNSGNNALYGLGGNDSLIGSNGNDTLDGGTGADIMSGGSGNDTYIVDDIGDVVSEASGQGTDQVFSGIDYTLTANVENLTLTGTVDINGTGNGLNNVISGNEGNNILDGGSGVDTMLGGTGRDTYSFNLGDGQDTIIDSAENGVGNIIAFGDGLTKDDLILTRDGNTLTLGYGTSGDTIVIPDFDPQGVDGSLVIDSFQFADGTSFSYHQLTDQAPVAVGQETVILQDVREIEGTISAVDPDGDSLSFSLQDSPMSGSLTLDENGTWTYQAAGLFTGEDTALLRIDDGYGGMVTTRLHFDVRVSAPTVAGQVLSLEEDGSLSDTLEVNNPVGGSNFRLEKCIKIYREKVLQSAYFA